MLTCLERIPSGRTGALFDRLIAFEVFDGPVTGIAFCRGSNDAVLFRLEAWDDQQQVRVFSVAPIATREVTSVTEDLASVETPRWPEWWLKAGSTASASGKIEEAVARAVRHAGSVVWIVTSRDLLSGFIKVARVVEGTATQRFAKLSHRLPADAEVSDGSFADWLRFIEDYEVASSGA